MSPWTRGGSIKQQLAGYPYNSTIVHLILAFILNAAYHHSAEDIFSISTSGATNITKYNATSSFTPKWEVSTLQQYMGNMSCLFEVGYWNLGSQKHPTNFSQRQTCGKLRYKPSSNYIPSNIDLVFDKLLSHGDDPTIYIVGDSIGNQHVRDLLCYFASESRLLHVEVDPAGKPSEKGCTKNDDCYEDTRGDYSGLGLTGATFQPYNNASNQQIHVMFQGWNKNRPGTFKNALEKGKEGDIFVINQGLHFSGYEPIVNALNGTYKDTILSAMRRGSKILWRETAAGHSNAPDGYWSPNLKELQANKSSHCISSSMINATASWLKYNNVIIPMLKSWGVDILEVWEAILLMPEWCHVGGGVDCAHFLQPGGTSYFTEALLKYIEEKM